MNKESLAVSVALRMACDQLAENHPTRKTREIRDVMIWEVSQADEPMSPERVNLMALRFACEMLMDFEQTPAYILEDTFMRKAHDFLRGLNLYTEN